MNSVLYNLFMTIYTRTGDDGTTGTYQGKRVLKSSGQIEAYGTIDELSSLLGVIISYGPSTSHINLLTNIQESLSHIMAYLSGVPRNLSFLKKQTKVFEREIDTLTKDLPTLTRFILPQGSRISAYFHLSRTVCRRAERAVIRYFTLINKKPSINSRQLIVFLNRLSDLLFILARKYNTKKEIKI